MTIVPTNTARSGVRKLGDLVPHPPQLRRDLHAGRVEHRRPISVPLANPSGELLEMRA